MPLSNLGESVDQNLGSPIRLSSLVKKEMLNSKLKESFNREYDGI